VAVISAGFEALRKSLADLTDPSRVAGVTLAELQSWYHDEAIWMFIEQGVGQPRWRVLQLALVRDQGTSWAEFSGRVEQLLDHQLRVPRRADSWRRTRLEALDVDAFVTTAREVWRELPLSASGDPGSGGDQDYESIPLSPSLEKSV
jgi:hypothetical protein